jgi:hypothetical protein
MSPRSSTPPSAVRLYCGGTYAGPNATQPAPGVNGSQGVVIALNVA